MVFDHGIIIIISILLIHHTYKLPVLTRHLVPTYPFPDYQTEALQVLTVLRIWVPILQVLTAESVPKAAPVLTAQVQAPKVLPQPRESQVPVWVRESPQDQE